MKAIELCLNRFDDDTKLSFMQLYTKLDAEISTPDELNAVESDSMITSTGAAVSIC